MANKKDYDVRWLHLSDFHFKGDANYDRDVVLRALLNSLQPILDRSGPLDLIFATGDIAFSGKPSEYLEVTKFFDALLAKAGLQKNALFVVPGNHDVDRTKGSGLKRTLESREEADVYFGDVEPLIHVSLRQGAFKKWYDEYFSGHRSFPERTTCSDMERFRAKNAELAILSINTSAFSVDDEDHAKLWVGRRCLDTAIDKLATTDKALKIALMHHPLEWLHAAELTQIKSGIRKQFDFILSGHTHQFDAESVAGLVGETIHLVAGATYQTRKHPNRAMIVTVSGAEVEIMPLRYEDEPQEAWTLDPSMFSNQEDFIGRMTVARFSSQKGTQIDAVTVPFETPAASGEERDFKSQFESDLFSAPGGQPLYAEPRLMTKPPEATWDDDGQATRVPLKEVVESSNSYFIETRPEYGSSSLCKKIAYEMEAAGKKVFLRDARTLPNYRRKLEQSFPAAAKQAGQEATLILDHFDPERDERLLREVNATNWFSRTIAIFVDRGIQPSRLVDPKGLHAGFKALFLWGIERGDVRTLAGAMFQSADVAFISSVVDKVYSDLLALCIPLTPANVIMYLRILHKEEEFHPLNRVDIVGRYISETLRKPGDAYADTFNSKNKLDVLSAFVHKLYLDSRDDFDERYWHDFMADYKSHTLTEFDAASFLSELIEARIVSKWRTIMFLRYSFYFLFFLGRYLATRAELLTKFMDDEEYLRVKGTIEVITGISSQNSYIVEKLTQRVEYHLEKFAEKYFKSDFDPLIGVKWPDSDEDEEKIWKPISKALDASPRDVDEIDTLKSSLVAEAKTNDQKVKFDKFVELESSLFATTRLLKDAIRNADDVEGSLKLRAVEALLQAQLVAFQVGVAFASEIASSRFFRWGGIIFWNKGKIETTPTTSPDILVPMILRLNWSVAKSAAEEFGTKRLGVVFRKRSDMHGDPGFKQFVNFTCILSSRSPGWEDSLKAAIERTDRNAYYLSSMLSQLLSVLRNEVLQTKDRDSIKRLIATVRAKRDMNKKAPGEKLIASALAQLEKQNYFDKKSKEEK